MDDRDEKLRTPTLLTELKRRNVFRVAAFYLVVAWLILQIADIVMPPLGIPEWGMTLVLVLLILGLPVAIFFAWVLELTPQGLRREREVDPARSITQLTGRRLDFLIIAVLVAAVSMLMFDKLVMRAPAPVSAADRSIAVLPFLNVAGDEQSAVFSDGLAETLTHMLAQLDGLHVAARTSAFQFRGGAGDVAAIGSQLRVRNLLEGSVMRAGEKIRITAQLVETQNGFHRWSESYDRRLEDVFDIQDDIARRVVEALQVTLLGATLEAPAGRTQDIEAYTQYLAGRRQQALFSYESLPAAETHFREAVRLDPAYADAFIALAATYLDMQSTGLVDDRQAADSAAAALDQARKIVGETPQVLTIAGRILGLRRDDAAAQRAFLAALEADPDNPGALTDYAEFLVDAVDRPAEALPYVRRALDFDPRSERLHMVYGKALHDTGRHEEALEQFARMRQINPEGPAGYYMPSHLHSERGDIALATGWMLQAFERDPDDHEMPVQIARYMLAMDDADAAQVWLERSRAINPDSPAGYAAAMDIAGYRRDFATGVEIAHTVLDNGAPRRYGARYIALWLLMTEAIGEGDGERFLRRLGDLYPELVAPTPRVTDKNIGYAVLLWRYWLSAGAGEATGLGTRIEQFYQGVVAADPDRELFDRTIVYALLGRLDVALETFARLVEIGDIEALWAADIEPQLEPLRATERYQAIMREVRAEARRQREQVRERHGV